MSYKGKFHPTNKRKYKGDVTNIIYRSLWEKQFMKYCDEHPSVEEWGSEEIIVPYISPIDGKRHRYFPDFYVKVRTKENKIKKWVVEVKPKSQCKPPRVPKRKTRKYLNEVRTFAINEAKWTAALHFCKRHDCEFRILTEKELKI